MYQTIKSQTLDSTFGIIASATWQLPQPVGDATLWNSSEFSGKQKVKASRCTGSRQREASKFCFQYTWTTGWTVHGPVKWDALLLIFIHDDIIKWKHFPRYWPFVRGIQRSPVSSPHTGQWRGALMFSLICAWINAWVNNREAGDLRRHRGHYDAMVMPESCLSLNDVTLGIYRKTSLRILTNIVNSNFIYTYS